MEYSLGILLCTLGVLVLVWAFVRPRRGDEPHCRACRFSLAGLTEPGCCPECGRDLSRPRSKVKGHRPSPKRAAFWCLGLVLIGGALIGLDAMNRTGFFPLTKYKPAFVLQAEAYVLGDLRASMATDELVDRINGGTLGKEAEDRLVKTALARHAQTWRGFPDAQWMVITTAMGRGELEFEQIEKVWNDSVHSPQFLSADWSDRTFYPGEQIAISVGYRVRAGKSIPAGMGSVGFAIGQSMATYIQNDKGEMPLFANISVRGNVLQRYQSVSADRASLGMQRCPLTLPERIGVSQGRVELEISFIADMVARNWPDVDPEKIDQLNTLKHTFSLPFTLEIVDPKSIVVPVVKPFAKNGDPSTLIDFSIVQAYSAAENNGSAGVMFRIGTNTLLDPGIGLGGYLEFVQADNRILARINYTKPHSVMQQFNLLEGFDSGPVSVTYQNDPDVARNNREKMSSVLGGPIDLGTFTIPEPETPEPQ